jgi:outer membrane lipoprotein SlyB
MPMDIKEFQTLTYPSDLDGSHFFPEAIHFEFFQRIGANLDKAIDAGADAYTDTMQKAQAAASAAERAKVLKENEVEKGSGAGRNWTGSGQEILNTKEVLAEDELKGVGEGPLENIKQNIENRKVAARGKSVVSFLRGMARSVRGQLSMPAKSVGNVYLHMPNNISLNEEAQWGGQSLGAVGMLTKSALKKGDTDSMKTLTGAVAGSAGNMVAAAVGGIAGAVLSKLPGAAMGGMIGAIAGETIQRGMESAFSVSHNPYMEMMFSGVGFRSFKFDFVFRARNKSEIATVGNIIKKFRQYSRPSWQGGSLGRSFMNYPQEFKIKFLTMTNPNTNVEQYVPNKHLPTLKPCVCSSVETNYTPQSIWSAFEDGAPVSITLGLTFQETELVMAEDVATEWPEAEEQQGINPVGSISDRSTPSAVSGTRQGFAPQ